MRTIESGGGGEELGVVAEVDGVAAEELFSSASMEGDDEGAIGPLVSAS